MNWSAWGAISLGLAVALGAFGAHGLKNRLDAYQMSVYEKAVFYHFIHGMGLLAVGIMRRVQTLTADGANRVGAMLALGILLFSGSLYALALTGVRSLGAITPFGGLAFIAAWALLAWQLLRG